MLIGICGGICAGKHSIQNYLVERYGFEPLELARETVPSVEKSASQTEVPRSQGSAAPRPPFASVNDLVDFTTANWQKNFCTTSIHSEAVVEALCHRPFFVLVHVDAPISIRWQRFKDRCTQASMTPPTLEQFVLRNDEHLYNAVNGLASLASRAQVKLLNSTTSLSMLHLALDALNLTDPSRMRPTWDHYFMTLASLAARRSNCMRRQVGCVLVRSNRVISTGYNGTPRNVKNCNDGGCPRCNDGGGRSGVGLSTCLCLHAEENALLEAGRERVGGGAVLYCNTCPCLTCSIKIVQVGITEVVFNQSYYMDAEAAKIFNEAGVKLRQFSPPKEGLVVLSDEAFVERSIHNWRRMDPTSKVSTFLKQFQMIQMWGNDGASMTWGQPHSEGRLPNIIYGPGVSDWYPSPAQPGFPTPIPNTVYPEPPAHLLTEQARKALLSVQPYTIDTSSIPKQLPFPTLYAAISQQQPVAASSRFLPFWYQDPDRTTYASLLAEQQEAFHKWRGFDSTAMVSDFLRRYQMIQLWGPDGASMQWGAAHPDGRQPNAIHGCGEFDWFPPPAQPGQPPQPVNPVHPHPPSHALASHTDGQARLAAAQQGRTWPPSSCALTSAGTTVKSAAVKRPAAESNAARGYKRYRVDSQAPGHILNTKDPLANVSEVAREVYNIMSALLRRKDYSLKTVDAWISSFHLSRGIDEIESACDELQDFGLIAEPNKTLGGFVPMAIRTWKIKRKAVAAAEFSMSSTAVVQAVAA
ncbi:Deoxycytidine monophosphate (dCMP) deaminase [Elasticomyces elasticus]|nr:Deoxycytidine monophosphate (dCMP) deaminase [Elasticomyces elasticus]